MQIDVPGGNGWSDFIFDLGACGATAPSSVVIGYGVRLWSGAGADGDGGVSATKPTFAVILVDSFWLEGSCPSTGPTAPTAPASGG
jgi:hypothetical protein